MKEKANQGFYSQTSFPSNIKAMAKIVLNIKHKNLRNSSPMIPSQNILGNNFIQPQDWENFSKRTE